MITGPPPKFHGDRDILIGLIDSLYFTVVTVTTTGYGDINLRDAPTYAKFTGMALMLLGPLILAVVFALVADAVLGARLGRALGHGAIPRGGHVIVCGVGRAGSHIIELLVEAGVRCVAVERDESAPDLALPRNHKVPLVIGDAASAQTLKRLRLQTARALIAMTPDDFVNLQCALLARERAPRLRVVLRLFDTDLARRVERTTGYLSRSVAALAAPAFAAALLGHRAAAVVPVGQEVMRLVWMKTGCVADIRSLEVGCEARVQAVDAARFPGRDEPIPSGTDVLVVGTRVGLAQVEPRLTGGRRPVPDRGLPG
jgi:Trk K+ transport system NAD-binding subunit